MRPFELTDEQWTLIEPVLPDWDTWCVDGRTSGPRRPPPGAVKGGRHRAPRSHSRLIKRRTRVQDPSGLLWARRPHRRGRLGRPGPRVQVLRECDCQRAAAATQADQDRRGQGLQLPACPPVVRASQHLRCDPTAVGSGRTRGTTRPHPARVQRPQRRRTQHRPHQGEPSHRHALREARQQLPRCAQARLPQAISRETRSVRHGLAPIRKCMPIRAL